MKESGKKGLPVLHMTLTFKQHKRIRLRGH